MEKSTEIVLAWELWEQGMSKSAIARRLPAARLKLIWADAGYSGPVELPPF